MSMRTPSAKPRIVLIDDNEGFVHSTQTALSALFEVVALTVSADISATALAAQVRHAQPDHVLLDLNLGAGFSSRDALKAMVEAGALAGCDVRLISFGSGGGSGPDPAQKAIVEFQRISARVKGPLIRKPIGPYDLMAALLDFDPYPAPAYWQSFPLPLRVLGRKQLPDGTWLTPVVYANPKWTESGAAPWQPPTREFASWLERGGTPAAQTMSGNPFDGRSSGYVIHSFPLQADDEAYLGQVVEHHSGPSQPKPLHDTVDEIFTAMAQAGFPSGQCFMVEPLITPGPHHDCLDTGDVRDIASVLTLSQVSSNHPQSLQHKLPLRRPLRGVLRQRVQDIEQELARDRDPGLVYRIRTQADDNAADDVDIRWWSQQIHDGTKPPAGGAPDRLEVPIHALDSDPITNEALNAPTLVAVLTFNRGVWGEDNPDHPMHDLGPRVSEDEVAPVKSLLFGLMERLRQAIFHAQRARFIATQVAIHQSDQKIHELRDPKAKLQQVLATLLGATQADHILLLLQGGGQYLRPEAVADGTDAAPLPPCAMQVQTPLSDDRFAVVKVWNSGRLQLVHDVGASKHVRDVADAYGDFASEATRQWAAWTHRFKGSVITYPVTVDGRTLGVFILYFREPWRATADLLWPIDSVAHRGRWVVQSIIAERERTSWLQSLGHELRRDLYTASNALEALERQQALRIDPSADNDKRWRRFRRNLLNATSLAENWMDMLRDVGAGDAGPPFAVRAALHDYFELNQDYLNDLKVEPHWQTEREQPIWGTLLSHRHWFERVLRVLLDNAVKFGRAHADQADDDRTTSVTLDARLVPDHGGFELSIRNLGRMDEAEYRQRFESMPPPGERKRDGAHVGLHAARKLTLAVGGELTLENVPEWTGSSPLVEARLRWPCATDKGNL